MALGLNDGFLVNMLGKPSTKLAKQRYKEIMDKYKVICPKCNKEFNDIRSDNTKFKNEVGTQLKRMTDLIHKLFEVKGEDL